MPGDERVSGIREPAQAGRSLGDQVHLGITPDLADGRLAVRVGVEVGDPAFCPAALRGRYSPRMSESSRASRAMDERRAIKTLLMP